MPYINLERRKAIESGEPPQTAGELNYVITQEILYYIKMKNVSYQTFNDVLGVLEGVKQEVYRRLIAQYEEKKKRSNGDVFV